MRPAYLAYWGLREPPFALAPNPGMFYLSDQHRECLMRLKYAIHSGKGGALLISENAGNGKTTTLNLLMQELSSADGGEVRVAFLDYPTMTSEQMVAEIARQLGVKDACGSKVEDLNALRGVLRAHHEQGIRSLVVVDEGQMLANRPDLLQELRILLNFCVSGEFLLSFILSGQAPLEPAVRAMPEFWQRLPVRFFLKNLHFQDTRNLIDYRLRMAGAERPLFTTTAMEGIYRFSEGCPRVICAVADLALVVGHSNRSRQVDFVEVSQACADMERSDGSYHYFNFLEGRSGIGQGEVSHATPGHPVGREPSPRITFSPASGGLVPRAAVAAPPRAPAATDAIVPVPEAVAVASALAQPMQIPTEQAIPNASQEGGLACAACGTHAAGDAEACVHCGGMLQAACGRCRTAQSLLHKNCFRCGFPLHAWFREAEREFLEGLKRLNMYRSPRETEEIKFQHHRTLEGRVLYFAGGGGLLSRGARVRELGEESERRLKGCGVIIGTRRLVFVQKDRKVDIPLSRVEGCEMVAPRRGEAGQEQEGGLLIRYQDSAYEVRLPVREGRRAAFYRLVQSYLNRMRETEA